MEKAKKNFAGTELKGKKLGVIGLGAIGVLVANVARHFGMEIYGVDPFLSVNNALSLSRDVTVVKSYDELYQVCDYITIHVPYIPETKGMLNKEAFDQMNFFEKTAYAGVRYGTRKEDIQELLDQGKFAVIPVDMCGAIAMKRSFPTHIIYVARDKEKLIADIIDSDYDTEEKTLRILSIDAEKRNRKICDHVIHNDIIEGNYASGAEELRRLIATADGKNAGALVSARLIIVSTTSRSTPASTMLRICSL